MKHTVIELQLQNGARGLLIDVPEAPVMGLDISFRAGDFQSPTHKWEVAHLMEHMVLGANKAYPKTRQFRAELQKNGAYMNASTGPYNLNYILESADFEWQRVLELACGAIEAPLFMEEDFDAERGNVREELVGDLNHNFKQLIIKSREKFGLVALSDTERIKQLENIELKDIRDFHKQTHTSKNMRFVLAGNVAERRQTIETIFEKIALKQGERIELPAETPHSFEKVNYIEKPDLQNVYFFFTTFARNEFSQLEDDAMNLVNVMLTATLHSRILGEARERGLAYHISSNFTKLRGTTGWWFGAELTPEHAEPVFEIIVRELQRLQNGTLDDADLEAAKMYSLGKYQRGAQTVGGIIAGYSGGYYFDDRIEDYFGFPDRIQRITKTDVIDTVRALFSDNTWGLSVMGTKQNKLAEQLDNQLAVLWKAS